MKRTRLEQLTELLEKTKQAELGAPLQERYEYRSLIKAITEEMNVILKHYSIAEDFSKVKIDVTVQPKLPLEMVEVTLTPENCNMEPEAFEHMMNEMAEEINADWTTQPCINQDEFNRYDDYA